MNALTLAVPAQAADVGAEDASRRVADLLAQGRVLEALTWLITVRPGLPVEVTLSLLQTLAGPALDRFNGHLDAGELARAEPYITALTTLLPRHQPFLEAALSCTWTLGRAEVAGGYAAALLQLDREHVEARSAMADLFRVIGDEDSEISHRLFLALSPKNPIEPMLRLRDIHDVASQILRRPLDGLSVARLQALLVAGRVLDVPVEPGSEVADWEKHYRLLLNSFDLDAMRRPAAPPPADADLEYADADGAPLDAAEVRQRAEALGAQSVFFAAADEAYVQLYARWYVLSILRYADVSAIVVVHVIGGRGRLAAVAEAVGVHDERLVYVADGFEPAAVAARCYEAPPQGQIDKPVAHYQSVRFQRLGGLLQLLQRPVFVSDIDLLLQRGVADLLERTAGDDVVLNENKKSAPAASRITANLLLARPTPGGLAFAAFLRAYLDRALAQPEITRWIDQIALIAGRHHLALTGAQARIGWFDTDSDINNDMYRSYRPHPFRFLSLYHGFDTASLEDPRVLGEAPPTSSPQAK